jgi:hypothetical protein
MCEKKIRKGNFNTRTIAALNVLTTHSLRIVETSDFLLSKVQDSP